MIKQLKTPEEVHVKTHALAYGGDAVGTVTEGSYEGMTAFVAGAVPGEEGRAFIKKKQKRFLQTVSFKPDAPSSFRVLPECPIYYECGGCNLQHISLEEQRQLKLGMVSSMLEKQAGIVPEDGVELLGRELLGIRYRRRITLHCCPKTHAIGFYKPKSHSVIPVQDCLITRSEICTLLPFIQEHSELLTTHISTIALEVKTDRSLAIVLTLRKEHKNDLLLEILVSLSKKAEVLVKSHTGVVQQYLINGIDQNLENAPAYSHFSQVNEAANHCLIQHVLKLVDKPGVTDLYAGSGNFSIPLAQKDVKVTSVELDEKLVNLGRKQGQHLSLSYVHSSCEEYLEHNSVEPIVILDPPRTGAKVVTQLLAERKPESIIYISCDLPTLTRDLKVLCAEGYVAKKVWSLDMFPQTHHIETVTLLAFQ